MNKCKHSIEQFISRSRFNNFESLDEYKAKMIITSDTVILENANIPHFYGELNPLNFTPYPKNPSIAKIFREIGFADELGSGVKNIYKYAKEYGGSDPIMVEDEVFRVEIKTDNETTPKTTLKKKILWNE